MNHATHCKFCKTPITVDIDDDYAAIGDPFKILPLSACNRCADLKVLRRTLEEKVQRACLSLCQKRGKMGDDQRRKIRDTLTKLTQAYAVMIARWYRKEGMAWDEECVNLLLEKPQLWHKILPDLWKLFEDSRLVA